MKNFTGRKPGQVKGDAEEGLPVVSDKSRVGACLFHRKEVQQKTERGEGREVKAWFQDLIVLVLQRKAQLAVSVSLKTRA
mmetsp:Transcript_19996/g.23038  ORF Transcript_19996/g.23038 Transcript_19996/m.23038 type:complete len:80 (-) Transcript_19996:217-456(-)